MVSNLLFKIAAEFVLMLAEFVEIAADYSSILFAKSVIRKFVKNF